MKPCAGLLSCVLLFVVCQALFGDSCGAATAAQVPNPRQPARQDAGQVSQPIRPLVIQAGRVRHVPTLRTGSPYASAQLMGGAGSLPLATIIEVDYYNNAYRFFHERENRGPAPVGVDQRTVIIDPHMKDFRVNFRYATGERNLASMLWQVSRYPFANDPAHWQQVPGLVASGQVVDEHSDSDSYRYFRINFARVASQKPGARPYFEGTASLKEGTASLKTEQQRAPVSVRPPVGIPAAPQQGRSRLLIPPASGPLTQTTTMALSGPVDQDHTYFVRVVPMRQGGLAGIPAIPVEVTVRRPHPCPTTVSDRVVSPPSARIVWYMRPNFFDSAAASGRWYVVHGNQFMPQSAHMKDPPQQAEDKAWYEKIIETFNSVVNYFSDVMTGMSQAWDTLQNMYVELYAIQQSYLIGGGLLYRCDQHDDCKAVVKSGLQTTMAMAGVPPTLPTGPELLDLSTEYLIELGADAFGAGELYDAYQELPPEVKQKLKNAGRDISKSWADSRSTGMASEMDKYLCYDVPEHFKPGSTKKYCTSRIPDPIFNSVHPATVLVYVENPNSTPTDRVLLTVTDSMGLFKPGSAIVPPLRAGQAVSVPVVLNEDLDKSMDYAGGKCPSKNVVTTYGELPCPVQQWRDRFWQTGAYWRPQKARDTFRVTFSTGAGANTLTGLDAQSSGRPLKGLIVIDPEAGGACHVPGTLRYPPGWQITTPTRSVVPESVDNLFDGPPGQEGNPNGGLLRKK